MNSYIRSILIITMVCHIFSLLTPSTTGIRKTYRFLCGMVVLAVIALPIRDVVSGIMDAMESWQIAETEEASDDGMEDMRFASATEEAALGWMRYISVVYGIPMSTPPIAIHVFREKRPFMLPIPPVFPFSLPLRSSPIRVSLPPFSLQDPFPSVCTARRVCPSHTAVFP